MKKYIVKMTRVYEFNQVELEELNWDDEIEINEEFVMNLAYDYLSEDMIDMSDQPENFVSTTIETIEDGIN